MPDRKLRTLGVKALLASTAAVLVGLVLYAFGVSEGWPYIVAGCIAGAFSSAAHDALRGPRDPGT